MFAESDITTWTAAVDEVLRKNFDKQLFYPKRDDTYRLLRLKIWSIRYKVCLEYILSVLIPHFEKISSKHTGRRRSRGIGTTIPVLTGGAAEDFLADAVKKDFPDGENILSWREDTKLEFLARIEADDELPVRKKAKSVLDYTSLAAYRKAYVKRITNMRDTEERVTKRIAKQPFRDNVFR